MGDKNQSARITATAQLKTGHGIIKAVYCTVPGDRIIEIINGTLDTDETIINIDLTSGTFAPILMPNINRPVKDGIRAQVVSGTTGELLVIYE